jgi:hypothetical protein
MVEVEVHKKLSADIDDVWSVVGPFESLADWHPLVPSCEMSEDGTVRTIDVPPEPAVERLFPDRGGDYSYVYTVESGPMPMKDYEATLGVREAVGGCVLYYKATCEPEGTTEDALKGMLEGFFQKGFDAVAERFDS